MTTKVQRKQAAERQKRYRQRHSVTVTHNAQPQIEREEKTDSMRFFLPEELVSGLQKLRTENIVVVKLICVPAYKVDAEPDRFTELHEVRLE